MTEFLAKALSSSVATCCRQPKVVDRDDVTMVRHEGIKQSNASVPPSQENTTG